MTAPAPAAAGSATTAARRTANYVLALLTVVYAFNYLDRQLLAVLMEPIKAEFGASDTELGMLTGFLFAAIYTVAGIPVARLADLLGRRTVIAVALAVWSAMTVLTGFANSFAQLRLARIGVALGESGGTPPSFALISDYFPADRRGTALGLFAIGVPIGTLLGNVLGGWIGAEYGWRAAFLWLGAPGLALALLFGLTVREPARAAPPSGTSIFDVIGIVFAQPAFLWMIGGVSFAAFAGYGFGIWKSPFLMRVHHFSLVDAGFAVGFVGLFTGVASSFLGGWLADRAVKRDPRGPMRVAALSALLALPFQLAFLFCPDPWIALLVIAPIGVVGGMWPPPTYAASQNLVPAHMRALTTAVLLFFLNLIGLGLGPLAVGMLSDHFREQFAHESIRYALGCVTFANLLGAYCYWRAAQAMAGAPRASA